VKKNTILVSGISGQFGRQVVERLLDQNITGIIGTTRTPDRHSDLVARGIDVRFADFDDKLSLVNAFYDAKRILLISTNIIDGNKRRQVQHRNAIEAAHKTGAEHVVYTSFLQGDSTSPSLINSDHVATETILEECVSSYTSLRNAFYNDMLFLTLGNAATSGRFFSAAGNGRIPYITREDCARAAAAALSDDFAGKRILDITGPAAINAEELAIIATEVFGRKIEYIPVTEEEQQQRFVARGMTVSLAKVLVGVECWVSQGTMDFASNDFADLTGKTATSVFDFLTANRELFVK